MSLEGRMDKTVAHIFNGIYSAMKGNVFESVLLRWINLDPVTQSEVRKRKTYHMLMHVYGVWRNHTDEAIRKAGTETQT